METGIEGAKCLAGRRFAGRQRTARLNPADEGCAIFLIIRLSEAVTIRGDLSEILRFCRWLLVAGVLLVSGAASTRRCRSGCYRRADAALPFPEEHSEFPYSDLPGSRVSLQLLFRVSLPILAGGERSL